MQAERLIGISAVCICICAVAIGAQVCQGSPTSRVQPSIPSDQPPKTPKSSSSTARTPNSTQNPKSKKSGLFNLDPLQLGDSDSKLAKSKKMGTRPISSSSGRKVLSKKRKMHPIDEDEEGQVEHSDAEATSPLTDPPETSDEASAATRRVSLVLSYSSDSN